MNVLFTEISFLYNNPYITSTIRSVSSASTREIYLKKKKKTL